MMGTFFQTLRILIARGFVNATKNPLLYWLRVFLYTGLALMIGSYWFQMDLSDPRLIDRMMAIFFGVGFTSFMSVAVIPAAIEDYLVFRREHENGLYGVFAWVFSNLLVSIPYVFIISFTFSVIAYWMAGFQALAGKFFIYVGYIFAVLMIAEAQTVLIS